MIRGKHLPVILLVGLGGLVLMMGVSIGLYWVNSPKYDDYNTQDFIDPDLYQAVFLSNDQIYFDQVKNSTKKFYETQKAIADLDLAHGNHLSAKIRSIEKEWVNGV